MSAAYRLIVPDLNVNVRAGARLARIGCRQNIAFLLRHTRRRANTEYIAARREAIRPTVRYLARPAWPGSGPPGAAIQAGSPGD